MTKTTTKREQPRTRATLRARCETCGFSVLRTNPDQRCPTHRDAQLIPWTTKLGIAMVYVQKCVRIEADLDRWVEETDATYYPGTTRGDMALALSLARKWGVIDESGLPSLATPRGLFG